MIPKLAEISNITRIHGRYLYYHILSIVLGCYKATDTTGWHVGTTLRFHVRRFLGADWNTFLAIFSTQSDVGDETLVHL